MRPWLVLTHFGIPFEEVQFPFGPTFDDPDWQAKVRPYNPALRVPALVDGDARVWESLAIIEHVAEKFPDLPIWPTDPAARGLARSIAAEMHCSFAALRSACPCNLGKRHPTKDRGPKVAADVARVTAIWNDARAPRRFAQHHRIGSALARERDARVEQRSPQIAMAVRGTVPRLERTPVRHPTTAGRTACGFGRSVLDTGGVDMSGPLCYCIVDSVHNTPAQGQP